MNNLLTTRKSFSLLSAFSVLALFALLTIASPRLGTADIPELPMADGSGDTPEMEVKMVAAAGAGKTMKLSSLRGKVLLMDMFWSQCSHCEEHAPHVTEFYAKYKTRGLNILGLATDKEEDVAKVRGFMAKAKTNYPVGFVSTMLIAYYADSHDHGVPQMVLFGTDGKMVKRTIGWSEKLGKEMEEAIEAELAKAGAAAATSAPATSAPTTSASPTKDAAPATVKPGSKAIAKPTARKTKQG